MFNKLFKGNILKKIEKIIKKTSLFYIHSILHGMEIEDNNHYSNLNSNKDNLYNNCIEEYNKINNTNFEFKEVLGKGGFGEVILIKEKKDENKNIVLKITNNKKQDERECKILSIPNNFLIKFYGSFICNNKLVMALEYYNLGNLRNFIHDVLKCNSIKEQLICYIAGQLINQLSMMNKWGFGHFDIKSANVLVNENPSFCLCDHSISKFYENNGNFKLGGTLFYMAPEILNTAKYKNKEEFFKPDVFSLGILLFFIFCNNHPYFDKDNFTFTQSKCKNFYNKNNCTQNLRYFTDKKNCITNLKCFTDKKPSPVFLDFINKLLPINQKDRLTFSDLLEHPFIKVFYNILLRYKQKYGDQFFFLKNLHLNNCKEYNEEIKKFLIKNDILLKNDNNKILGFYYYRNGNS